MSTLPFANFHSTFPQCPLYPSPMSTLPFPYAHSTLRQFPLYSSPMSTLPFAVVRSTLPQSTFQSSRLPHHLSPISTLPSPNSHPSLPQSPPDLSLSTLSSNTPNPFKPTFCIPKFYYIARIFIICSNSCCYSRTQPTEKTRKGNLRRGKKETWATIRPVRTTIGEGKGDVSLKVFVILSFNWLLIV